ncbi:GNAT family N-acetyltransferase [Streptomyces hygroscopicus subsp. hygroscopicus]|nr:GNAT family N-acetyltransferase [Streptomyces hygroscopicus subsp. hygroscopicus]
MTPPDRRTSPHRREGTVPAPHRIDRLTAADYPDTVKGLAGLLVDAVDDNASVGFLAPFDQDAAVAWWQSRAPAVADGTLAVWVCRDTDGTTGGNGIVGTVGLAFTGNPNGRHRAEVVKLIVHREARGRGIARALLATAEAAATAAGITLLLLDTRTGSTAERVYAADGWTRYGVVPDYAGDPDGSLAHCSFFYKQLAAPTAPAGG